MTIISIADRRQGVVRRTCAADNLGNETQGSSHVPSGFPAIGIDLGTTNSVVSIYHDGTTSPLTLSYADARLVPSVLHWDGSVLAIGQQALTKSADAPHDIIRSTKRSMGSKSKSAKQKGGEGPKVFHSGGRAFGPEEAAAAILSHLMNHPEIQALREKFGSIWAVVTVPAHFDDAARRATIEAAQSAGIQVLRIINEPTAAALAYSFLPRADGTVGKNMFDVAAEDLVVFDLGGGTFDVSVVHREGLVFKVLASEGDMALGGDDLDEVLAAHLQGFVEPSFLSRRIEKTSKIYPELLAQARLLKHQLCESGIASVDVAIGGSGGRLRATLDRQQFDDIVTPTLERTLYLTEQAIQFARVRLQNVSRILLVGGSTRVPLVQRLLESYFPGCNVDGRLEPDLAVSWGAALQAAIIQGSAPDTVLVDVCSHTLGIGVVEDSKIIKEHYRQVCQLFGISGEPDEAELRKRLGKKMIDFNQALQSLLRVAPIIRRNSPLPARKSEFFSTLYENQVAVNVVISQGEADVTGENRFIGSFIFDLVQPCPLGTKCEIQLTYDVNGMVQIFARQIGSSNEATAVFDSRSGTVSGWNRPTEVSGEQSFFASNKPSHLGSPELVRAPSETVIFNALLQRSRRLSKARAAGQLTILDEDFMRLNDLSKEYERSLRAALAGEAGEPGEDLLDQLEQQLQQLVESIEQ
jgi:molecular chaperone DnaK